MPNYRKKGYEDFSAELQGARIKRLLKMTGKMNSTWTAQKVSVIIGRERSVVQRKLTDEISWSEEEIRKLSEATDIPFQTLYVYDNASRMLAACPRLPVLLPHVTSDPKLLNAFLGTQLDSKTRDSAVRHLVKLEKWISENKEKIRKRRNKEREMRKRKAVLRFAFRKLHEEFGVWPYELIRMKKIHGNYLQFQERFDELKEKFDRL